MPVLQLDAEEPASRPPGRLQRRARAAERVEHEACSSMSDKPRRGVPIHPNNTNNSASRPTRSWWIEKLHGQPIDSAGEFGDLVFGGHPSARSPRRCCIGEDRRRTEFTKLNSADPLGDLTFRGHLPTAVVLFSPDNKTVILV